MTKQWLGILIISISFARVPDATGKYGAVTSSNEYASRIGLEVLKNGGNAIDAAIATGFALAVVHPAAGNIGGGGFMLIRFADGTVTSIDFRETAPATATRDMFLDENGDVIPGKSWNTSWAAGVPGSVSGYGLVHEKYGSMSWKKLLKPSIQLAKKGFRLDYQSSKSFEGYRQFLGADPMSDATFLFKEQISVGDLFVQSDLGQTLNRISKNGPDEFYNGKTADMILQCMDRTNGLITKDDLNNYHAIEREPIKFEYRGYSVYSMPPPSSGGIALAGILNQLENINLSEISYHSAEHIHYMTEAERRVYADRSTMLGDMDFVPVPIEELISQDYANEKWSSIDSVLATPSTDIHPKEQVEYNESGETTHFSVVDKWGNAVSVTTTINGWFGNGITVDGAGFLLNNEMDDFSSKPGVPNAYGLVGSRANEIAPGKRMLSSMTPSIVENADGNLFLVTGSPGGSKIITTTMQVISNVIDFEMNIEDAVEEPRYHHQWLPDVIFVEPNGYSIETIEKMEVNGYHFALSGVMGEANCIMVDPTSGLIHAAGDSRRGASALAY
ncbi:MAG: gamma-glutamyltransferase [Candidatus Marinimicrobia bacterium]|nr:gamma-glutamyltransferase [Candidatus Neomarinimicrobiota bacterium]